MFGCEFLCNVLNFIYEETLYYAPFDAMRLDSYLLDACNALRAECQRPERQPV